MKGAGRGTAAIRSCGEERERELGESRSEYYWLRVLLAEGVPG